jgi:hypothetical protein
VQVSEKAWLAESPWRERVRNPLEISGLHQELTKVETGCVQVFKERTWVMGECARPDKVGMQTPHGGERTGQPLLDSRTN